MSIKVIIVAVLALIVMIVLIMIMTGKTKIFSKVSVSCEQKGMGAHCIAEGGSCEGPIHKLGTDCKSQNDHTPWCCVPIG